MVCISHLRVVVLVDFPQLPSPSIIDKLFYFVGGLGHQSVIVFFVLSGFFVGGSVLRNSHQFSLVNYFITRLTRLWVVLIPALLITFMVGELLVWYVPETLTGKYDDIWHSGPNADTYSDSLITLFGNLLFLQGIFTPIYGVNGPLWSLANEFWYYMVFPMLLISMGLMPKYSSPLLSILVSILALVIFNYMPMSMRYGFVYWCFGVGLYFVLLKVKSNNVTWLISTGVIFFTSLLFAKLKSTQYGELNDFLVAVSFTLFCIGLANLGSPKIYTQLFIQLSRGLSEISYSLYLSHFPIVILIGALMYRTERFQPSVNAYFCIGFWLLFLLGIGTIFWFLFERHTNLVRKFMLRFV